MNNAKMPDSSVIVETTKITAKPPVQVTVDASKAHEASKHVVSDAVHRAEDVICDATEATKHSVSDVVHRVENAVSDAADKAKEITAGVAMKTGTMLHDAGKKMEEAGQKVKDSMT